MLLAVSRFGDCLQALDIDRLIAGQAVAVSSLGYTIQRVFHTSQAQLVMVGER
ncbi:hypothetical protein D3C77_401690 [compost metagenome]